MNIKLELPSLESLLLRSFFERQDLGSATGFVTDTKQGPLLITCRHVVTGRDQTSGSPLLTTAGIPDYLHVGHNGTKAAEGVDTVRWKREALYETTGSCRWIEHPTLGSRADVIGLPLSDLTEVVVYPVTLKPKANPIRCRPSDNVSIVGFPFGRTGGASLAIWASGFIASELDPGYEGLPAFLVDSRSRPGQSGSPVFAYRTSIAVHEDGSVAIPGPDSAQYRFLGVYSGRIHPDSDIGIVWKASVVADIVERFEAGA